MRKLEQIYEGKAKRVFKTDDPELVIVDYKDDATAFNGEKKGIIIGKGVVNNRMTNHFMRLLSSVNIPTHFVQELSNRETLVRRVDIIPLEVIVRNIAAGSFSNRYGVNEGVVFKKPTLEFSYKNDALGDPLINSTHIYAMEIATPAEVGLISEYAYNINDFLKANLLECDITLVDFKLEFGKTSENNVILADEISPDTCRFWDAKTGEKLDKDRFRQDLDNAEGAYQEMSRRIFGH